MPQAGAPSEPNRAVLRQGDGGERKRERGGGERGAHHRGPSGASPSATQRLRNSSDAFDAGDDLVPARPAGSQQDAAAGFPSRPIRIISTFAPGAVTDILA
jgi:hypothetical protein